MPGDENSFSPGVVIPGPSESQLEIAAKAQLIELQRKAQEAFQKVVDDAVAAARADEREIVADFVGRWVECRVCKKRHHIRDSHRCFYCKDYYCPEDAEKHFNGHRDGERMEARGHLERVRVKAWNEALSKFDREAKGVLELWESAQETGIPTTTKLHGMDSARRLARGLKLPEAQPVEPSEGEGT